MEERLGGAFADRKDEELFVVDAQGDDNLKDVETVKEEGLSRRARRAQKPLKCFQHLEIKSGVKDPVSVRNRRKTPQERKNPTLLKKQEELRSKGIVK